MEEDEIQIEKFILETLKGFKYSGLLILLWEIVMASGLKTISWCIVVGLMFALILALVGSVSAQEAYCYGSPCPPVGPGNNCYGPCPTTRAAPPN